MTNCATGTSTAVKYAVANGDKEVVVDLPTGERVVLQLVEQGDHIIVQRTP